MAFIRGDEMLKSLQLKQLTVDLGWLHNTLDYMGFHLHEVIMWKTSREIFQYQHNWMMIIAQALFFQ